MSASARQEARPARIDRRRTGAAARGDRDLDGRQGDVRVPLRELATVLPLDLSVQHVGFGRPLVLPFFGSTSSVLIVGEADSRTSKVASMKHNRKKVLAVCDSNVAPITDTIIDAV